ncbi:MAG: radical SAM/SPASM domain-containing protein [Thermoanaerobaculia bacterium]
MSYSWERLTAREKDHILEAIASGMPAPPPGVVELNWQDRCNIDCFFCSTAEIRAGGRQLSGDRLLALFDEMKDLGVKAVRLTGGGEPLFRKDAVRLIEGLGSRGIRIVDVTTNGVLLTEPVVRAIFSAGCDQITVSLNTGDAESYAAMMRTSPRNFDRVIENVQTASRIKRETGAGCMIRLQFLIYRENFRQIPRMHRVFLDSGADRFWFNGLYPVTPIVPLSAPEVDEMLELYEGVLDRDLFDSFDGFFFWESRIADRIAESTRKVFRRASLWRRAGVKWKGVFGREERELRETASLHEFCLVGWYSATVNANGDVVPCCVLQDRKTAVLGNLNERSLSEVWNGEGYERLRAELRELMARRGEVSEFDGACFVEGICARKGECPNRSYYWTRDPAFRRRFHRVVEGMEPPSGSPFAGAGARPHSAELPAFPAR